MKISKARLLATTLLGGALAAGSASYAHAQDEGGTVSELVVTGSRIPRPNLDQPTPVSTISQQLIQNSGTSNLGDVIAQLPALSYSGTVRGNGNSFGDSGGLNFPDLRDLGTSRTLTLVDGKRHVAGDAGDSAVDLNSIPTALVDRVEVITGGASAIYGSDAVSGVVNIITKKDFEGVEAQVEFGQPWEGKPGRNTSAYLTVGHNFDNDRANFTFTGFWDQAKGVKANDIRSLNNYGTIVNSPPFDGAPDRLLVPYLLSDTIDENGVILDFNTSTGVLSPLAGFTINGTPVTQPPRTGTNSTAFGSFAGPCDTCFALEDWMLLSPPTNRRGLATTFRYAITPNVNFSFDGKFVQTKVADYVQPSFSFGDYVLEPDSAFITPAIQARLDTLGPDSLPLISRFNGDLGARTNNITRETWRFVTGFDGKFTTDLADVTWELSYNRGQTSNVIISRNSMIPGNYAAAVDSVIDPNSGAVRCRVDVPEAQYDGWTAPENMTPEACVPYNPFGQQNSVQALEYVRHEAYRQHKIDQEVVTATFGFDTSKFLNLDGGAVGFAGGFEYRKEDSENINDPFIKAGYSDTAPQPDASGGFDVKEVFLETRVPLLANRPYIDELTIDAAIRYADYSTVGSATAWKVGGVYAPVRDVKFRGTYSEAVRAPNITEAFLPTTSSFFDVEDPCDADDIGRDPDRAANCAALGLPPGFVAVDNQSIQGTASGNEDLDPEKAKSWTVGFVLQPRWTPNFAITLDYYNIKITDAITFIEPQDIVNNCVDASGGPDEAFCSLFTRNPATNQIDFVESTYLNASKLETSGWDLTVSYQRGIDDLTARMGALRALDGNVTLSITANHLDKLRLYAFQDRPDEVQINEKTLGNPEWKLLANVSYDQGPVRVAWKTRYVSRSVRYSRDPERDGAEAISPSQIEPVWYHDVIVRWKLPGRFDGFEVYGGINNLFDEEPPLGVVQGLGDDGIYDLVGRYAFAGLKARF
jgi:iron complex outermembrane recepter protein